MNLTDAFNKVADRFETNPESWTQGVFARDAIGSSVQVSQMTPVAWCAVGALREEVTVNDQYRKALRALCDTLGINLDAEGVPAEKIVTSWNDSDYREVDDVVALFRDTAEWMNHS